MAEAIAAAVISSTGSVTCGLWPWSVFEEVGEIGQFPWGQPPSKQGVAIACRIHRNKCSCVHRRAQVSDVELLQWLFKAKFDLAWPQGSVKERARNREEHTRDAKDMKAEWQRRHAATSSSG